MNIDGLIFDRTQADVSEAKQLRGKVLHKLRGCYNASDMERVSGAVSKLAELLNAAGYAVTVETRSYGEEDIIRKVDWQKYLANVQVLRDAYYVRSDTPSLPQPEDKLDIEGANAIERTLNDIYTLIQAMQASYRKCGTFTSGSNTVRLPLKRS